MPKKMTPKMTQKRQKGPNLDPPASVVLFFGVRVIFGVIFKADVTSVTLFRPRLCASLDFWPKKAKNREPT